MIDLPGIPPAEELRRRNQGLAALLEVSKNLVATLDLEAVLQAATDGVARLSGLETSAVYLLDGDTLRLWATTPPLPPQFPEQLRSAPLADHPHLRQALSSGRPVIVPDLAAAELTAAERSVTEIRGLRSAIYLPLAAEAKSSGALIVGSVGRPWSGSQAEIDLCRTLANLAALAVENARLYKSGRRYAAELERLLSDRDRAEQERLELERRLLHAQKLESLGVLAGGIAHDFNNLLMAILGNLDLALSALGPLSPARPHIEQSAQAARRATDLTRQMLAYSGRGRFMVKSMDLSELVEENAHLLRTVVARTAELELRLDRALPRIEADPGQLQQVIMNLLTNASEALGGNPGRISLATGAQSCDAQCLRRSRIAVTPPGGRFVYFEVSDTGCGMDESTQRRLFEPFFTTKATGRGLGMSAILGIVRGHRGAIFMDSSAGRGTTIRILFPVLEGPPPAANDDRGSRPESRPASEPLGTVLVVDDEAIVRHVSSLMVASLGLKTLTAADGREAVEMLRANAASITHVLLDLTMPNLDGMSAFEELVRLKPGVKVILCSGYNEQDTVRRLSGRRPAAFLQKPYTVEELREALRAAEGEPPPQP